MKTIINLFYILGFSFITSCGSDYNSSTQYPIQHTHDYGEEHDHSGHGAHSDLSGHDNQIELGNDGTIYGSTNRGNWQKPRVVLDYFGNLKGKVLADIGAGPVGYFTLYMAFNSEVEKILSLDIDQSALDFINESKRRLNDSNIQNRIETRIVLPNNPKLKEKEADAILISNTLVYIQNRKAYLEKLNNGLNDGGQLVIVDYKMKKIPDYFPPVEERMPLYEMEQLLEQAGYKILVSDDFSLPYQYIIVCTKS